MNAPSRYHSCSSGTQPFISAIHFMQCFSHELIACIHIQFMDTVLPVHGLVLYLLLFFFVLPYFYFLGCLVPLFLPFRLVLLGFLGGRLPAKYSAPPPRQGEHQFRGEKISVFRAPLPAQILFRRSKKRKHLHTGRYSRNTMLEGKTKQQRHGTHFLARNAADEI